MRILIAAALLAGAALSHAQTSPAKKELVAKVLQLQQPAFEGLARNMAERPAAQMMQAAGAALQTQVPPEKREAAAKAVDAEVRKYVDEAVPLLRERAVKLAPSVYGAALEEKFSEDELRQLVTWLESPVNRKFQQAMPELQNSFTQKLIAEAAPLLDPKIQALQAKVRAALGLPPPPPPSSSASAPASAPARTGAPAAKPAAKPASK